MKLLIVTQVVDKNDPVLGFFHRWLEEFAKCAEQVTVICLYEGVHSLPENVSVHSLGKESGRQSKLAYTQRFLKLSWKLRSQYGSVFVHMNHEYLLIAGWLWRLLRKRISLWYVHRSTPLTLRLSLCWPHVIFTASDSSFRLQNSKLRVVGHGIDVEQIPEPHQLNRRAPRILCAGRIAPAKNQLQALEVFARIRSVMPEAVLTIAGSPILSSDVSYHEQVTARASANDLSPAVRIVGALTHAKLLDEYGQSDLLLHISDTGSLDKVVLEALAAGIPVVTTSEAFKETDLPVSAVHKDTVAIANKVKEVLAGPWEGKSARAVVRNNHSLTALISRLVSTL